MDETTKQISLSNLARLEPTLAENGIEPIKYLIGYLKGRAPPPILWNDDAYLDTGDFAAWRGQLRAEARMAQIKAMEEANG